MQLRKWLQFGSDVINELYFHGWLPREDLRYLFQQHGDFLVRITEAGISDGKWEMVLSALYDPDGKGRKKDGLVVEENIINLIIHNAHNKYCIGNLTQFNTVDNLVDHYLRHSLSVRNAKMKLKRPICLAQWEIRADDIHVQEFIDKLGCLEIRKGYFQRKNTRVDAAVTMVHGRSPYAKQSINEMLRQCRLLRNFRHPCVIEFYGVCLATNPCCFLLEYVSEGPLDEYLRNESSNLERVELLRMVMSAGWGLQFIHSRSILHRDLSARNCFYDKQLVKISGFGLARKTLVYAMKSLTKLPVQWMAPETLRELRFTQKSDVYTFGVLVYEIFSQSEPYEGYTSQEAKAYIMDGVVNELPPETPEQLVYFVKDKLWNINPDQRPSIKEVTDWLANYTGFKLQMGTAATQSTVRHNPDAPAWKDMNYKRMEQSAENKTAMQDMQKTAASPAPPTQMLAGISPAVGGQEYENLACLQQNKPCNPATQQLPTSPNLSRLGPEKPIIGQTVQPFMSEKAIPATFILQPANSMKPMTVNSFHQKPVTFKSLNPTSQRGTLPPKHHTSMMSMLNLPIPGQADYGNPIDGAVQPGALAETHEFFDNLLPAASPNAQPQIPTTFQQQLPQSPLICAQQTPTKMTTGEVGVQPNQQLTKAPTMNLTLQPLQQNPGNLYTPTTNQGIPGGFNFVPPPAQSMQGVSPVSAQNALFTPGDVQQQFPTASIITPQENKTRTLCTPTHQERIPPAQGPGAEQNTVLQFQQLLRQVAGIPNNTSNKAVQSATSGQMPGTSYGGTKSKLPTNVPRSAASAGERPGTKPLSLQQFQQLLRQVADLLDKTPNKTATAVPNNMPGTEYGGTKVATSTPNVPQSPQSAAGGAITLQQFQQLLRQTAALPDNTSNKAALTAVSGQMPKTACGGTKVATRAQNVPQASPSAAGQPITLQQFQQLLRQTAALPDNTTNEAALTAISGQMPKTACGGTKVATKAQNVPQASPSAAGQPITLQQFQQLLRQTAALPDNTTNEAALTAISGQMPKTACGGTKVATRAQNVPQASPSAAGQPITLQQFQQLLRQTAALPDNTTNEAALTAISGQMPKTACGGTKVATKAQNVPQASPSAAGQPITLQQFQQLLRQTAALPDNTTNEAALTAISGQMPKTACGGTKVATRAQNVPQASPSAAGQPITLQQFQQLLRQTAALPDDVPNNAIPTAATNQVPFSTANSPGQQPGTTAIPLQFQQQMQQYLESSSVSKKPIPTAVPEQMRGNVYSGTKTATVPQTPLSAAGGPITLQQFQQLTDNASDKAIPTTVSDQMQRNTYAGANVTINTPQSPFSAAAAPGQTPGTKPISLLQFQQQNQQPFDMPISGKPIQTAVPEQMRRTVYGGGRSTASAPQKPQSVVPQITTNRPISIGKSLPQGFPQSRMQ